MIALTERHWEQPGSDKETAPAEDSRIGTIMEAEDVPTGPTRASGISSSVRRQRAATSAPMSNPFGGAGGLASIIAQQAMQKKAGGASRELQPQLPLLAGRLTFDSFSDTKSIRKACKSLGAAWKP